MPEPIVDLAFRMKPSSEKSLVLKKLLVIHRLTQNLKSFRPFGDNHSDFSESLDSVEMQETNSYEAQTIKVEPVDRTCEDTPMKNVQPYDLSANPSNLTSCIEQFHNELSECDQVNTRRSSIFSNF